MLHNRELGVTQSGSEPVLLRVEPRQPQTDRLHERLLEHSQDVISRLRLVPELKMEYINPAAERTFGYPLAEFYAADLEFILRLHFEEEWDDLREVSAGRRFYSTIVRHMRGADGREFWMEVRNYPTYDERGRLTVLEGVMRDVTEREKALHALQGVQQQQQRLIESLPDLVMRLDETGVFAKHLPTDSRLPAKFFLGRSIESVVHSDAVANARQALKRALAGSPQGFRCNVDVWGEERAYDIRLLPTGEGDLLAFLRDVTGEVWWAGEADRQRSRDALERKVEKQFGIRNPYQFTFREFTVLHLVARGASDKEIAGELGIALSTVNKHVSNILGKMNAASRTEAGVRAVQEGLASV
jgi:PAS domain S-box-containing protein